MQINSLLVSLIFAISVSGHGFPISFSIAGKSYKICTTDGDPATRNIGAVDWEFATNGPIENFSSPGMACNVDVGGQPGTTPKEYATANAGDEVSLDWGPNWPPGHVGPKDFYLARCQKDCTGEGVTQVSWFKIGEVGHDGGEWHDTERIDSVTLPTNIKAGFWILRGSRLALHTPGDPQLYPHCYRLKISAGGSAEPPGIKLPGGLNPNDPGYTVNIYDQSLANYTDPGPAVYHSDQTGSAQTGTSYTDNGKTNKDNTVTGKTGTYDTTGNKSTYNNNNDNNDKTDSTHTTNAYGCDNSLDDSIDNNDSNPYNPYTSEPQDQKQKTYKRNARHFPMFKKLLHEAV